MACEKCGSMVNIPYQINHNGIQVLVCHKCFQAHEVNQYYKERRKKE